MHQILDQVRRTQGRLLEAIGFGPNETPFRIILNRASFRLRAYGAARGQPTVVIVPAPIKRAYIWDLDSQASAVRHLLDSGITVYLVEWMSADEGAPDTGLSGYADRYLGEALEAVARDSGGAPPVLAGHSLGGTLAAIFSALHPERLQGLVLLESPLRFGPHAGAFAPWLTMAPHASGMRTAFSSAPGSFLTVISMAMAPDSFVWSVWADRAASLHDPVARRLHGRVLRWALDELAMPGRLFEDVVEQLYRRDQFWAGTLRVGARAAAAADMAVPILAVADPLNRVTPLASVLPDLDVFRRPECLTLSYEGDRGVAIRHVGVLVGANAHRSLWPRIVRWIRARYEARSAHRRVHR
ncbi:MAG TPA: alpha/beta fold hydrolase [Azospirillum sp.]|nr:alpha/beta fold hydrolase [Azospirillum sp.]